MGASSLIENEAMSSGSSSVSSMRVHSSSVIGRRSLILPAIGTIASSATRTCSTEVCGAVLSMLSRLLTTSRRMSTCEAFSMSFLSTERAKFSDTNSVSLSSCARNLTVVTLTQGARSLGSSPTGGSELVLSVVSILTFFAFACSSNLSIIPSASELIQASASCAGRRRKYPPDNSRLCLGEGSVYLKQ